MTRFTHRSRTFLVAALGVLPVLAAVGCNAGVDASSEREASAGDNLQATTLEPTSAGSDAPEQSNEDITLDPRLKAFECDSASAKPAIPAAPVPATMDPIVGVAHGRLLLPDRSTPIPTPKFAREAQRYYLQKLLDKASNEVRAAFERRRSQLAPVEDDGREFVDNALLIAWLIKQVQPDDASDLNSINRYIAKAMVKGPLPKELRLVAGDKNSGMKYQEACREARVPIPPTWNPDPTDPKNLWHKVSTPLSPIFIGEKNTTATVWYYESTEPPGICIALPRTDDSTDVISSLGVICQGATPAGENANIAKACFWDNTGDFQPKAEVAILSDGFNAGPDLDGAIGGKCTDCHRGQNAFISHPDSDFTLDLQTSAGITTMIPALWILPIVHDQWFQNSQPGRLLTCTKSTTGDSSCTACHDIARSGGFLPDLGPPHSKYCDFVILNAILPGPKKTMPAQGATSEHYRFDEETIVKACGWDTSLLGFGPSAESTDPVPPTDLAFPTDPVPSAEPVPSTDPLPAADPVPSTDPVPATEPVPSTEPVPQEDRWD